MSDVLGNDSAANANAGMVSLHYCEQSIRSIPGCSSICAGMIGAVGRTGIENLDYRVAKETPAFREAW